MAHNFMFASDARQRFDDLLSRVHERRQQTLAAPTPTPAPAPAADPNAPPSSGNPAFDKFYNTPFYQVPLHEGFDAINANYAARGVLESGAAEKDLLRYGQGQASSAFGDYIRLVQGQQGVGIGATNNYVGASGSYGSNIAALGTNYANGTSNAFGNYATNSTNAQNAYNSALSGLYAGMGNAQSNYATNVGNINSNAAIAKANNTNSMVAGIGNAATSALGYFAYAPNDLLKGTPYG